MTVRVMVCCVDIKRRNKISLLLQQMGMFLVAETTNVHQALRMARSSQPNLIVMDIETYDNKSLEITMTLAREKIAPIILITAPYQQGINKTVNEDYIMSYVVRPINKCFFESAIQTALANFRKMEKKDSEIDILKNTLETRKLVERAKYILMKNLNISEPDAFRRMQKISMDKSLPMKDLAQTIILNEELKEQD